MKPANPRILTVNGGSSSIKFALKAVGHRVVHGGPKYSDPQLITKEMVEELRQLTPFDPEHLPEEILLTEAFHRRFPDLPQVACFDTAFHHDLPLVARFLPIPRRYEALGVRRYGFHGLSYSFLMGELARLAGAEAAQGRVILAHLGNGASLAAVRDGKPVDTSMGFTPTAGVPMSTRSGDLDPGLVWYLACSEKMSAKQFNEMVSFQSGLLGISETSSDMRDLMQCEAQDVRVWGSIKNAASGAWSPLFPVICHPHRNTRTASDRQSDSAGRAGRCGAQVNASWAGVQNARCPGSTRANCNDFTSLSAHQRPRQNALISLD
jgi:acetate kinase